MNNVLRRGMSALLTLALVLSLFSVFAATAAGNDTFPQSGTCGENLTWTLDEEGTLTISGTGDMYDYTGLQGNTRFAGFHEPTGTVIAYLDFVTDSPWDSYCEYIFEVVIDVGVTSIGAYAFCDFTNLSSITIPNSITDFGSYAFADCISLESIEFDETSNLEHIANDAFYNCDTLNNIMLPYGVTDIGYSAFGGVPMGEFRNIMIPDSVTAIGTDIQYQSDNFVIYASKDSYAEKYAKERNLFFVEVKDEQRDSDFEYYDNQDGGVTITYYNYSVPDVKIPNTLGGKPVTAIGDEENFPFENQLITSVKIPDTVTRIAPKAFAGTAISSIAIPAGVTDIGNSAFRHCGYLKNVIIPSSVTHIGAYAFADSGLVTIEIPQTVTLIDDQPFFNCSSLRTINVDNDSSDYTSVNGVLFDKDVTALIVYPAGKRENEYTIPNGVTNISPRAFSYSKVRQVTIPDTVTDLSYVFMSAGLLTDVNIPTAAEEIGDYSFYACINLKNIDILEGISVIENFAFGFTRLADVVFPSSLERVGFRAFEKCQELTEIVFGANSKLTTGDFRNSFYNYDNSSLISIKMPTNIFEGNEGAFSDSFGLAPKYMQYLVDYDGNPYYLFDEYGVLYNKNKTTLVSCPTDLVLEAYEIPDGVITIGAQAFSLCKIKEVIIPNTVTNIGGIAFWGAAIERITIPDSVTTLGLDIFVGCENLEIVNFGAGVSVITSLRIDQFINLVEMNVSPNNPYYTSIDGVVYSKDMKMLVLVPNNTVLTELVIPNEVEEIANNALGRLATAYGYRDAGSYNIEEITFSPNLKEVPNGIWSILGNDIDGIETVIIPESNPYFTVENGCIYDQNKTKLLRYTNLADKDAIIPFGISMVGTYAFRNISLDSITFPASLTTIEQYAFSYSTISADIELPRSLKIIERGAFANCDVNKISIPKYVVEMDESFQGVGGHNHTSTIVTEHGTLAEKYARRNNMYLEYAEFAAPDIIYPEIIFEPTHSTVLRGENAMVSVTAVSEIGVLSYQWYLDGVAVGTEAAYTFTPGETRDYNIFCVITNVYDGGVAQTKSKTVVINCVDEVKSDVNFGYDNWNFTNDYRYFNYDWDGFVYYEGSDNYEMKQDYLTILKAGFPVSSAIINEFNRNPWKGSCFGMSAAEVLIKAGYIDPTFFQANADETYYLTDPNYSYTTESLINYYHLMQICTLGDSMLFMKNIANWYLGDNPANNGIIVNEVKNNAAPVVLTFQYRGGAHSVVAYGYKSEDGKHVIQISDPNNNTTPLQLTLNGDYTDPKFWLNGALHPFYNDYLVLRNTLPADELNYWNLQDKLTEFGAIKAAQRALSASESSVAEQSYYFMNTNYDSFTVIQYDRDGEEKYRAVI